MALPGSVPVGGRYERDLSGQLPARGDDLGTSSHVSAVGSYGLRGRVIAVMWFW